MRYLAHAIGSVKKGTSKRLMGFSFVLFCLIFMASSAYPATYTKTWTTKGDFENNAVTTGTATAPYQMDTSTEPGKAMLSDYGDQLYQEDFSTTDYRDDTNTNAEWGDFSGIPGVIVNLRSEMTNLLGADDAVMSILAVGGRTYFGTDEGRFGYIESGVGYDLTKNVSSYVNGEKINNMAYDDVNGRIYLAGGINDKRVFVEFDIDSSAAVDLKGLIPAGWGTGLVKALAFSSYNGNEYVYLAVGSNFGRYNGSDIDDLTVSSGLSTFMTGNIYSVTAVTANMIYLGGGGTENSRLARFSQDTGVAENLDAKVSTFWPSYYNVTALAFDPPGNRVYMGTSGGHFASYNVSTDTGSNLSSKINAVAAGEKNVICLSFAEGEAANYIYLGLNKGNLVKYRSDGLQTQNLSGSITAFFRSSGNGINALFASGTDIYAGGGSGMLARIGINSGIATDLTVPAAEVCKGYGVISAAYDPNSGVVYISVFESSTYTAILLRYAAALEKLSEGGIGIPRSMIFDRINNVLYIGSKYGYLYRYDPLSEVVTNLSEDSGLRDAWGKGTATNNDDPYLESLAFDSENGTIYIGTGQNGGAYKFGRFDIESGGFTDLSNVPVLDGMSYIKVAFASYTDSGGTEKSEVYIGDYSAEKFVKYNTYDGSYSVPTTGYTGGIRRIQALAFDSINKKIYIGCGYGKFYRYNLLSNDFDPDLSDKIAPYINNPNNIWINFDPANNVIFWSDDKGTFIEYKIGATFPEDEVVNLKPEIASLWKSTGINTFYMGAGRLCLLGSDGDALIFNVISPRIAQSIDINDPATSPEAPGYDVGWVTLDADYAAGEVGNADFYISNDGGITFEAAVPGEEIRFNNSIGSQLIWRAEITGDSKINSVNITYSGYNPSGNIEGLKIDGGVEVDWANISWTGTLNGGGIKFQTRSAATEANLSSKAWSLPEYTVSGSAIVSAADRWLEIKAQLETSDAAKTPVLDEFSAVYVVNAPPEITNVTVNEDSSGVVQISYDVKDIDTLTGAQAGKVDISFQYYDGSGWKEAGITTGEDKKSVQENGYTTYTGSWNAKQEFGNKYITNCKIKVDANDQEAKNNIGTGQSAPFILDTKNPSAGSVTINAGSSKAKSTDVSLTLSVTDDTSSGMQMMLGPSADFTGLSYQSYVTPAEYALASSDGVKMVYAKFKDKYGNESAVFNDSIELDTTPPQEPQNIAIYDISVEGNGALFVRWTPIDDTDNDFVRYNISRSVDSGAYALYSTEPNILMNYFVDEGLDSDTAYSYKIASEDDIGNISAYSAIVGMKPSGEGSADALPPIISEVAVSNITNITATITWNTDEPSDSTVGYSKDKNYANEAGSPALNTAGTDGHSITISGLSQDTTYYYRVKSKDTSANLAVEDKDTNGALLTFTTTKDSTGPVISDIEAVSVTKDSAAITWATDELATSQVQYGTGGSYNNFTVLDEDLETSHSVVMKALNPSTGYSYLVISKDSSGNESVSSIYLLTTLDDTSAAGEGSIDGEGEEAVVEEDTTAPTIFSVAAASVGDTSATITWLTNESSTSQVEYGTGTSYGSSTTIDIDLELSHTSALSGLTADTAYHYKVRSKDSSGNEAVSGDYTFTTLKESESEGVEEKAVEEEKKAGAFLSFVGSLFRRDSGASSDVKKASSEASEKAAMVEAKRVADIPIIGTSGPVLADISSTEATIAWTTTIPANSIVAFRPESQGDEPMEASFISAGDFNKFVEEHAVNLKGLYPNTVYEFQVKSMDSQGKVNASGINNFETLSEPTIFDVKASDITSDSAVITWKTNIPASSKVEYGSGAGYGKKAEDSKGLSFTTLHVSGLKGLESEKVYHYRVASTDLAGRVLTSGDMTFKTPPRPKIGEYSIAQLTPEKAVLKWKTNVECDSTVEYTPYRKKKLIKAEAMAQMKPELSLEHEMIIGGLEIGITYQIKIKSKDLHGNDAAMKIPDYTAKVDTTPLEISQVRARNALLAGNEEKIQTIISWQTSRPASSQIIYQAGVKKDPRSETKTPLDTNLTTNHVVVLTSLRPAAIYRFNVASVDGFNNSVTSEDYTLLTPQKKKGIIQVIAEGFEEKFGWVKNIRGGK